MSHVYCCLRKRYTKSCHVPDSTPKRAKPCTGSDCESSKIRKLNPNPEMETLESSIPVETNSRIFIFNYAQQLLQIYGICHMYTALRQAYTNEFGYTHVSMALCFLTLTTKGCSLSVQFGGIKRYMYTQSFFQNMEHVVLKQYQAWVIRGEILLFYS